VTDFRYKAFISYSWADADWGRWLHHAIETFRTPAALVGQDGRYGPVPPRLHPLFKDREEEAAGASIGQAVEAALGSSEFLIVICSPRSASSEWVGREVAWFKTHRDPTKVLALIVDGEPGGGREECFPKALTHAVGGDLVVSDERIDAPLAADARVSGDGKRLARLKLAAAMLGVGLDELVRRDERRRTVRTRIIVGTSLALALVMSALALAAVRARDEARHQRSEADGLVEFMLTDLREKLEPVGRLDALDVVGKRALTYYAQQDPGSLDADSLGRRSRALHLVGEVTNIRGDSAGGLAAFRQAAKTTAELLARDPENQQRIFDHAQSVFWVGYIAYERGDKTETEANFRAYKRLADRLVALNPGKPEWRMESSYAETNLGVMYDELRRYPEAERAFTHGLTQIEAVAADEPYSADRQLEIGTTVNWLGKTMSNLGKASEALALHQREIAIYTDVLRRDPVSAAAKNRLAVALQFLADIQRDMGDLGLAIATYDRSLALSGELRRLEPGNTEWQQTEATARIVQAQNLIYARRLPEARAMIGQGQELLAQLVATDPSNAAWTVDYRSRVTLVRIRLALAGNDPAKARALCADAIAWSAKRGAEVSPLVVMRLHLLAGDAAQRLGQGDQARAEWTKGLSTAPALPTADPDRYQLLRRLGREGEAAAVAARLDRRGFRHPAYLAERR
jgi:tetratricopeptide (TPR) repeat protein